MNADSAVPTLRHERHFDDRVMRAFTPRLATPLAYFAQAVAARPAAEALIVGKPCPVSGERVHAFVCLKEGVQAGADELQRFRAARLADYKVPETFTLGHAALPRNANGKLLKRELRARFAA